MIKNENAIGRILMQIALAALLFIGGVSIFNGNQQSILSSLSGSFNDLGARTIQNFFEGDVQQIVLYIFAAIEIVAGVLLIVKIFARSVYQVADIFLLIVAIVFIVGIVMIDVVNANWSNGYAWNRLYSLAKDVLVLSTMIMVTSTN
ncbi:MAG: hypothetical protein BKP49_03405 [Treponema sp. CETP13]|nr:MAG: hypothetical protein BKP49_03405 [Treponema sp. CETP13]